MHAEALDGWRHEHVFLGAQRTPRPSSTRASYPSLAPLFKPITEFVPDSPLEGDGFEPSVPHTKQPFWLPRSVTQFAFREKTGSFVPGTDGSNPFPCREEAARDQDRRTRRVTSLTSNRLIAGIGERYDFSVV